MAKANTQQIVSIKDERLNIDHIDHYRLSFFIGHDVVQLAIKDIQTNRLLLFEQYQCDPKKGSLSTLEALHKEHVLIAAGFWKEIQVFIRNNKFALVPNPLFDKSKLHEYIRLNGATDLSEDTYHFKQLDDFGLSFAFGYKETVKHWFKAKYPKVNLRFSHQGVAFLNYMQKEIKQNAQASMYLDIKGHEVMVAGLNFEKLALYNQFSYKNPDHLVKLAALSCQQFSSDRAKTPLIVTGQKAQLDLILPSLKKYFQLTEMGKRPIELKIHPVFNELETFEYTEILANL